MTGMTISGNHRRFIALSLLLAPLTGETRAQDLPSIDFPFFEIQGIEIGMRVEGFTHASPNAKPIRLGPKVSESGDSLESFFLTTEKGVSYLFTFHSKRLRKIQVGWPPFQLGGRDFSEELEKQQIAVANEVKQQIESAATATPEKVEVAKFKEGIARKIVGLIYSVGEKNPARVLLESSTIELKVTVFDPNVVTMKDLGISPEAWEKARKAAAQLQKERDSTSNGAHEPSVFKDYLVDSSEDPPQGDPSAEAFDRNSNEQAPSRWWVLALSLAALAVAVLLIARMRGRTQQSGE